MGNASDSDVQATLISCKRRNILHGDQESFSQTDHKRRLPPCWGFQQSHIDRVYPRFVVPPFWLFRKSVWLQSRSSLSFRHMHTPRGLPLACHGHRTRCWVPDFDRSPRNRENDAPVPASGAIPISCEHRLSLPSHV